MSDPIIKKTNAFVQDCLAGAERGHDWFHSERVWKMAKRIRKAEGKGDLLTIELAALLHDISDPKFNEGDEEEGAGMAYHFLVRTGVDRKRCDHVRRIIRHISFKGGLRQEKIDTAEFRIVQDADRLDAMGAVGIARAFNYGGFRNRPIYDPSVPPRDYKDTRSYRDSTAPTINHFHEKLLKLKELMNTETGRRIATERHEFMLQFLDHFYREWDPE
jgi:uncharacterized protein